LLHLITAAVGFRGRNPPPQKAQKKIATKRHKGTKCFAEKILCFLWLLKNCFDEFEREE
jgi:hypothetical protein